MASTLACSRVERQAKLGGGPGAIVAIDPHVTEVSARLRAARERAGLTIRDISASTKIQAGTLEAIERGDFASLPGEFYTRAFIRTYAAHLGLSPQAILADYESERPPTQPAPGPAPAESPVERSPARRALLDLLSLTTSTGVVIALLVALLIYAVGKNKPEAARPPEPGTVGTSGQAAAAPTPAGSNRPAPAAAAPGTLTIAIEAEAPLWITGAADGERVLYRLLAPGERVTIAARETLAFRIGDASAFRYSINGVPGKPLGGAGEVRDVEITRANVGSFAR